MYKKQPCNSHIKMFEYKSLIKIVFISLLFFALFSTSYSSQNIDKSHEKGLIQIHKHLPGDYNSSGQCFDVEVDTSGLVYAATNSGIVVYDGSSYTTIEHPDNLPVRSLLLAPDGTMYAGFRGDFGELVPDSTGNLHVKSVLPRSLMDSGIWEIWYTETINDTIFFSSEGYLYRYLPWIEDENSRIKVWDRGGNEDDYFINIFECFGQLMISRTLSGLQVVENDSLVTVYSDPEIIIGVKDGVRYDKNRYLLSTSLRGMFLWDGKNLTEFESEISRSLIDLRARYMMKLSNQRFALSTSLDGVFIFDKNGNIVQRLDISLGLSEDKTAFMCLDHENGLWVATNTGFSRCDLDNPIQIFNEESGLRGNVYAITRFDGVLYAGTSSGLFKLMPSVKSGRAAHFIQIGERNSVWDFCQIDDCLLIFTVGDISYLTKDDPEPRTWKDGPLFALASAATQDKKHFFYGMYHKGIGLAKWENNMPSNIIDEIPSGQFPLNMILEDNDQELWYCADSRMIQRMELQWIGNELTGGEITTYDTTKGLPSDRYRSFILEGKRYWGSKSGLFTYNKELDTFQKITTLGSVDISESGFENPCITPDGDIWFNGKDSNGMRLINLGDGEYIKEWPFDSTRPKHVPVFFCEDDGTTWGGSLNGKLYRYNAEKVESDTTTFKALVRQVELPGDSVIFAGNHSSNWIDPVIRYGDNSIRIRFSLPRYKNADLNEYQYRLIGLAEEWSEWSSETYHDFNSLKGGKYIFEVRGKDAKGLISGSDKFHFTVLSPWYLTTWMSLIYILSLVALVVLIVRLSIQRIEKDRLRLEKLVDEKTEEVLVQFERVKAAEIKTKEIEVANQLAATIAHEFNNPLAIIQLCLDTNKMKNELNDDEQAFHDRIENQVGRMKRLVQKILELDEIKKVNYAASMKILDIHHNSDKMKN